MICHKHKCIFIHIPRCGGTYIEELIQGEDQWFKNRKTKHLIASQAKEIYKDYWEDYFKFSIIRNPFDRMTSAFKTFPWFFGENINDYRKIFPQSVEYDYRFYNFRDIFSAYGASKLDWARNQIYLNTLNEELDFIAKYENFEDDLTFILDKINCKKQIKILKPKTYRIPKKDLKEISKLFKKDIEYFNFDTKL